MDKSDKQQSTKESAQQRASTQRPAAHDDGSPKFGRLLIVLLVAVMFCGVLTWVMAEFFPNFPS